MSENKLEVLKFDAAIPTPYESKEKSEEKWIASGTDNNYPNFLLKLYNGSPVHSSIVNSKSNYIIGDGLKLKNGNKITAKVNAADSFNELITKVVKDYLIFNCFAIEIVYNKFNQPIEYHFVPVNKVRCNKSKTKFWVSEDWIYGDKPIVFDRWIPKADNSKSKIFFFDGYNPSASNVYPTPEYSGSITSILTDIAVREFNLNNIKNHFSVSTIITFFRGSNVADDIKNKIIKDLKESYTGTQGKKLIVDFQDPTQPSADVKNISPNDWDKAYELIGKSVKDDIIQAHQVTSPLLFGVATPGQLGGGNELETAYEIFQNTYTRNKRNELISAFNILFSNSEIINGELEFAEKQLFNARISESLKEKIYTINELRKEAGLAPINEGDKFINDNASTGSTPVKMSSDVFELTEEDFDKIKDLGVVVDEFDFIEEGEFINQKEDFNKVELKFEMVDDIASYILDNNLTNSSIKSLQSELRKELGINVSANELKGILNQLTKAGILNVIVDGDNISVSKPDQPSRKIEVMYSYEVRKGYGSPIINTTRPFCRKLVENNRFYSLEDIQTMTTIFGYEIFNYGGGFYRNPTTGEVTPHCRHWFKANSVTRKTKK